MRILISFFFSITLLGISYGQDSLLIGKKYLEDQIYLGVTYNILTNEPQALQQKGISSGLNIGFIKDIPLNQKGSFSVGLGIGYGYNKYIHNMKIQTDNPFFSIIENNYTKNNFVTHAIEIPLELRFRTSSPTIYKFWRVYLGAKVSYIFASKSRYVNELGTSNTDLKTKPIPSLNKIQFGPQVSLGYGTLNFYAYYNINGLFQKTIETEGLDVYKMNAVKIGLQFYIF